MTPACTQIVWDAYRDEFQLKSIYSFWSDNWAGTRLYPNEDHSSESDMARMRKRLTQEALGEAVGAGVGIRVGASDVGSGVGGSEGISSHSPRLFKP